MIKRLHISNFRSIRNASVTFADSGLAVVVGANGTGKSNLIKCLQFLASVAENGLEAAMYSQRSMEAVLPKALSRKDLKHSLFSLSYDFILWSPPWYPAGEPPLLITHDLALGSTSGALARIAKEALTFSSPLLAQYYEAVSTIAQEAHPPSPPLDTFRASTLSLAREETGRLSIATFPAFETFRNEFLRWLGLNLPGHMSAEMTHAALEELLSSLQSMPLTRDQRTTVQDSWVSLRSPGPLAFCSEANTFKSALAGIRRYDLQLTQLRTEQESSPHKTVSVEGRGLPGVIRRLQEGGSESESWRRVAGTLQALAPHIADAKVRRLKSGKEFIEFIESKVGREVESWESSDGTLRALAILAAVETHGSYGVLLIEEPEQGLHPWAIRILLDHVREAIRRRGLQVIMTTHSPQVLDNVTQDEVIVASRSREDGTRLHALTDLFPNKQLDMGEIGKLWVRGLLGGVPTYDDF